MNHQIGDVHLQARWDCESSAVKQTAGSAQVLESSQRDPAELEASIRHLHLAFGGPIAAARAQVIATQRFVRDLPQKQKPPPED